MTAPDDHRVREMLEGMNFPAERDEVIEYAQHTDQQDSEVLAALDGLPDRIFSTVDDVVISVPEDAQRN